LRYFKIDSDTIEFARDIIRDVLPLKHLNKICKVLKITCYLSYVDETGKQHSPQQYGLKYRCGNPYIDLIVMFEHYMPNITFDKSVNAITNRTVKLSTLISMLFKKRLFIRLDMKYSKSDTNKTFNITDFNCKPIDFDKTYGIMKDSYDLMKSLLKDTFGYHGRLKSFIKAASYGQILFPKKSEINEAIMELDDNMLYATAMTNLRIPICKQREK
jgi:hypothetical protein